jgi:hypothetical protein
LPKQSWSGFYARRAKPIILTGVAVGDLALRKHFQAVFGDGSFAHACP